MAEIAPENPAEAQGGSSRLTIIGKRAMTPEQSEWLKRPTILPPVLRQVEGSHLWEFVEEYRVSLPPPHFPLALVIPVGWRYDRSSIPEYFVPSWMLDRDGLGCLAPAPHDAGYKCRGVFDHPDNRPQPSRDPYIVSSTGMPIYRVVTRAEVDTWFLLYLLRQRVPSWRAKLAYWGVRAGNAWEKW